MLSLYFIIFQIFDQIHWETFQEQLSKQNLLQIRVAFVYIKSLSPLHTHTQARQVLC